MVSQVKLHLNHALAQGYRVEARKKGHHPLKKAYKWALFVSYVAWTILLHYFIINSDYDTFEISYAVIFQEAKRQIKYKDLGS